MKKVIVMRGIPGAGKSTWARANMSTSGLGVICSADDYFVDLATGEYKFDPAKIGLAHQACFREFLDALRDDANIVIVDNTNTQRWEITPYTLAAETFGYEVDLVRVTCSLETALSRNIHGVPREVVEKLEAQWEPALPWWNERTVAPAGFHSGYGGFGCLDNYGLGVTLVLSEVGHGGTNDDNARRLGGEPRGNRSCAGLPRA